MAGLDTSQTPCPIGGEVNPKRLSVLISHHRLVMRSHLNCRMGHALKARVWARSGGVLVHKLSRAPAETPVPLQHRYSVATADARRFTGRLRHLLQNFSRSSFTGCFGNIGPRHNPAAPARAVNDRHASDAIVLHLATAVLDGGLLVDGHAGRRHAFTGDHFDGILPLGHLRGT